HKFIIQAFQSIALRFITKAPWYVSNFTLHNDLKITNTTELAKTMYKRFHQNLCTHSNALISHTSTFTLPKNPPRRLKRK
ncbi:zinc finger MYM-type protein 6-like, partial [Aphis craccivora]